MTYLIVKWLHILSSTLLLGTGLGSAFLLFSANRGGDLAAIRFAARHVVLADWIFTTPAVLFQAVSGLYLVHQGGFALSERWLTETLGLFALIGFCWLPVVWIQIKMRDMADRAGPADTALPLRYWIYDRWWIALGALAFPATLAIFWLMVVKPV